MASVHLEFSAPVDENIVALRIYEATTPTGMFTQIERVTAIGSYPSYITEYTTTMAASLADSFAITWEDSEGVESPMSNSVPGGTNTLVGILTDRVMQRDSSLNRGVVTQEAEAAIVTYFGDNVDPYDPSLPSSTGYRIINGLTYMVMARTMMAELITSSTVNQATLGLVSFKADTSTASLSDIKALMELAQKDLGINGSMVMSMPQLCQNYGGVNYAKTYYDSFARYFNFEIQYSNGASQ